MTSTVLIAVLLGLILGGLLGYFMGHKPQPDSRTSIGGLVRTAGAIAALV